MGQTTTQIKEQAWLDIEIAEIGNHLRRIVKVPLTQGQFDALVCWSFNVGRGAVARSTLIKLLNRGHYELVPEQLERWVYDNGNYVLGLRRRRLAEIEIWKR